MSATVNINELPPDVQAKVLKQIGPSAQVTPEATNPPTSFTNTDGRIFPAIKNQLVSTNRKYLCEKYNVTPSTMRQIIKQDKEDHEDAKRKIRDLKKKIAAKNITTTDSLQEWLRWSNYEGNPMLWSTSLYEKFRSQVDKIIKKANIQTSTTTAQLPVEPQEPCLQESTACTALAVVPKAAQETLPKTFQLLYGQHAIDTIIDPEFESLIASLSLEEYSQLKESIRAEGIREPLIGWMTCYQPMAMTLLDGHHRYRAWRELNSEGELFSSLIGLPLNFANRDEAMLWIETNQAGRRNLTDDQRAVIWDSIRERRSKIARAKQLQEARESKGSVSSEIDDTENHTQNPKQDTRKEIAAEAKIPENKLKTVAKLKKTAPEKLQEVRQGKTTLRQAVKAAAPPSPKEKLPEASQEHKYKKSSNKENLQSTIDDSKKDKKAYFEYPLGPVEILYSAPRGDSWRVVLEFRGGDDEEDMKILLPVDARFKATVGVEGGKILVLGLDPQ